MLIGWRFEGTVDGNPFQENYRHDGEDSDFPAEPLTYSARFSCEEGEVTVQGSVNANDTDFPATGTLKLPADDAPRVLGPDSTLNFTSSGEKRFRFVGEGFDLRATRY